MNESRSIRIGLIHVLIGVFGFKKGLTVEDAWAHVKDVVSSSREEYILGIFVDCKGDVDNLCWSKVIERLMEVRCQ